MDKGQIIHFAVITELDLFLFFTLLLLVVCSLVAALLFNQWVDRRGRVALSPYSGLPMRRGGELAFSSKEKILRYLYDLKEYDNRIFEIRRAAVCRETGRIFPEAITWYGLMVVDWSFLIKRYPGRYVSWGSLSLEQQEIVSNYHFTLKGFQTAVSSPKPSPKAIEKKYALAKPGPLYVDMDTYILLGWKIVPGTEFEVLIVQKPIKKI